MRDNEAWAQYNADRDVYERYYQIGAYALDDDREGSEQDGYETADEFYASIYGSDSSNRRRTVLANMDRRPQREYRDQSVSQRGQHDQREYREESTDALMHLLSNMDINALPAGVQQRVDIWQRDKNDRNDSPQLSQQRNSSNSNAGRIYDPGNSRKSLSPDSMKSRACDRYLRGQCEKGNDCLWSHDKKVCGDAVALMNEQLRLRSVGAKGSGDADKGAAKERSRPTVATFRQQSESNDSSADSQEE